MARGFKSRRPAVNLSLEEEGEIVTWYRENEILYNSAADGFYNNSKKERMWAKKAAEYGLTGNQLKTFVRLMRMRFVKLLREHRGDPPSGLPERKRWLLRNFEFLRDHVTHRRTKGWRKGSRAAGQGARRATSHQSRGTKARWKEDQGQSAWSVVDVSVDEELGWEMEDEESLSPSLQGEQWRESSHRNIPPPSESQDWTLLPGQVSLNESCASQQSVHGVGKDMASGSKRRKLQSVYSGPHPVEECLAHQTSKIRDMDPKVVILTPARKPVQHSTARMSGQIPDVSSDSVEMVSVKDICYASPEVQANTKPGGSAPYKVAVRNADYRDGGLRTGKERGSLSQTAGGAASSPSLDLPVPMDYSSSEDHCFTCQNPLLSSDSGKKHLLEAVQGKTKLLHILRQMGWPGLYSHDCVSRTCCGDCAELIHEYNDMLRALHALKGKWMECTGHNSAPHFNQFHHEAFMNRDSCIESSRSNCVCTERRNQCIPGVASHHQGRPRKEQLSNQFTEVNIVSDRHSAGESGSSQKDTHGVSQDLNSAHVSAVESPHLEENEILVVEPHQVSDPHVLLQEGQKTQIDVEGVESPCTSPQMLPSQHHKPVLKTKSTPPTVPETSRKASQSHHQLQPGIADDDLSMKSPGKRVREKYGLSHKEREVLDIGTAKHMTTCSDPASEGESLSACDSPPPRVAAAPVEQLAGQGQKEDVHGNDDVGPKTDHNFDPGQDRLSVTIKQEQEDFYSDEVFPEASDDPGGSSLTLQSLDTGWDSPGGT